MLAFLQRIGKALMLPVATLPAAALLVSFGLLDYEKNIPLGAALGGFLNQYVAPFLLAGGLAILDNLALIFAVGVAIGLARDAVAALAAVMAYHVLLAILARVPAAMPFIDDNVVLKMGVFGGILAGGVAAYCYNKYHDVKMPEWLGFFSGKRFVPIVTSLSMVVIAFVIGMVWAPIQEVLDAFGNWVVSLGAIGSGIFLFFNRLLIPLGLHHVLNAIAWFQIGSYTDAAGNVVHGDLHRFFAGDPSAGMFMAGFFPIMMFALPGAALAMIHTAKPGKRKLIASVFMAAALSSILTGITEPLEFAFMFAAPILYVVHALLTGISGVIVTSLGIKHGFSFSAGLIDYLVNYHFSTNALLIIPVGLCFAIVYYVLFRIIIVKFNLKTLGREDDDEEHETASANTSIQEKARNVLACIGGKENVVSVDACITRLRLVLKNDKGINEKGLRELGAAGVIKLGQGSVQVVFGTQSEALKDEINKL
ncbi:N-acetylglucosamine-specific PTS transporter subunit IIBC [Brevibacillus ruminantium]|uniref:N-acetylglucosamine-specific PTS transporter subunit IIBC n=1 Tax=Brevibacillus ruminantium TaxID=2950604 RepID=A0ABY4WMK4_9BACL|nr:N-acetylglucosamine-specific PTS transporter subunit IIBC [Brevibacillus ruminantium]USG65846.1 N-acetylglucosamine-specific PTS transporter subunit IIBC [Brevibacillus ruminantium]